MNKKMKDKKLADETMDRVFGGAQFETISDNKMAATMMDKDPNDSRLIASGSCARGLFMKAGIKVYENSGANVYEFGGRRISRYEALVRMTRAHHFTRHFDIAPYLEASHMDNEFDMDD